MSTTDTVPEHEIQAGDLNLIEQNPILFKVDFEWRLGWLCKLGSRSKHVMRGPLKVLNKS